MAEPVISPDKHERLFSLALPNIGTRRPLLYTHATAMLFHVRTVLAIAGTASIAWEIRCDADYTTLDASARLLVSGTESLKTTGTTTTAGITGKFITSGQYVWAVVTGTAGGGGASLPLLLNAASASFSANDALLLSIHFQGAS